MTSHRPLILMALPQENVDGRLHHPDWDLAYCGVGKVNAALTAAAQLADRPTRLVINIGTAGSHYFSAGQLVVARRFMQRDMDATPMGFALGETPFEQPLLLDNGLPVSGLPEATCFTGDSFVTEPHPELTFELIDMEAYAIAKACARWSHRFVCVKFISDGANGQAAADWPSALSMATDALIQSLPRLIAEQT